MRGVVWGTEIPHCVSPALHGGVDLVRPVILSYLLLGTIFWGGGVIGRVCSIYVFKLHDLRFHGRRHWFTDSLR